MYLQKIIYRQKNLKVQDKNSDPDLDPLVRGADPVRIRTKMSRIPNTVYKVASFLTHNSLQFTQIYNLNFKGVHWQNSFAFNIWKKSLLQQYHVVH